MVILVVTLVTLFTDLATAVAVGMVRQPPGEDGGGITPVMGDPYGEW